MSIVDHFDPRIYEHLEAWRKFKAEYHGSHVRASRVFVERLGFKNLGQQLPDDWEQLIRDKMADAWLEEKLGAEPVAGDLRVPRLRRGGGETPR